MKKRITIALAAALTLALAACGGSAEETAESAAATEAEGEAGTAEAGDSDETVNISFISVMSGGAAWGRAEEGFNAAVEELGWNGQYLAPSTVNDQMQMLELTETAITNGADALVGVFMDPNVFGDVVGGAFKDGVYVASTNTVMGPEYQNFWIGTDPEGMGISQAEALVKVAGDQEVTVVYMQTNATATTQNEQFAAFTEYLKDYPNITVFGQEYCDSSETTSAEKIANLVRANPEINAVVCADGNGCIGAANYVDENDNQEEFIVIGIDDDGMILGYVKNGILDCTIAQNFYGMGYESVMMINDIMNGEEVPFDNDSGTTAIFAENVDEYAAENAIEVIG